MPSIGKNRGRKILLGLLAIMAFMVAVWLDSRSKWISNRNQSRTWIVTHAGTVEDETSNPPALIPAPWSIRMCGEAGVKSILIDERKMISKLPSSAERNPANVARVVGRLFPEATIHIRDYQGRETLAPHE
jgi:hypothetical protein